MNRPATITGTDRASTQDFTSTVRQSQLTLDAYREQLATNARDTGMAAARRADPDWSERVLSWIWNLPTGLTFDADTISSEFGRSSAAGAVIRTSSQKGYIRSVGLSRSKSATRHGGFQLTWERT